MAGMTFPNFAFYSCCEACCPSGIKAQVVDAAAAGLCGCVLGTSCGCDCCCQCCCRCRCGCNKCGCGNVQSANTGYKVLSVSQTPCGCGCGMHRPQSCGEVDPVWGVRPQSCGCGFGLGSDPLNPCCPGSRPPRPLPPAPPEPA